MDTSGAKPFVIERRDGALRLRGDLQLSCATEIWCDLQHAAAGAEGKLDIDLSDVAVLDGAAVALLVDLRARLVERGVKSELVGATGHLADLVGLYQGYQPATCGPRRRRHSFFEHFGADARAVAQALRAMVEFVGDTVRGAAGAIVSPISGKRLTVFPLIVRAGTEAIPLVLLLNFLLGFVMAYDSSGQLERYGAELYLADVVGVAVTREIAPVITSIIVLGRSAAAYAAELGTMKVSEEIDALRTLGFSPTRTLVLPRVVALALVAPVLTLLGDVVGVAGGAVVGSATLGVTAAGYLAELKTAVVVSDVWSGLVKSVVFGIVVAHIGCQQGFATRGGAEGVGRRTTTTVVICLFALVILDTLLTMFFRMFES